ncbi:hypothetical protein [Crocinitomix algicola]|uniref:hypothetical protein n=1 Tax=Crocinitomix algicola TaxID=1740263 RepID=UPI0008354C8C|nr:hypothetical protein [Crocinitomix algicola]
MATKIDSNKVIINANQETVFTYLTDFNNIKELLPQDKISDWKATTEECSFKIQNAAVIPLVKDTVEPNGKINIKSGENAPFPFTLEVFIEEQPDNKSQAYLKFEGEINAFLKMMVVKPLTNLFNYMADRIQEVHS